MNSFWTTLALVVSFSHLVCNVCVWLCLGNEHDPLKGVGEGRDRKCLFIALPSPLTHPTPSRDPFHFLFCSAPCYIIKINSNIKWILRKMKRMLLLLLLLFSFSLFLLHKKGLVLTDAHEALMNWYGNHIAHARIHKERALIRFPICISVRALLVWEKIFFSWTQPCNINFDRFSLWEEKEEK